MCRFIFGTATEIYLFSVKGVLNEVIFCGHK